MARDRRLFFKFFNSGLLDRGHLTIRQREIVIDRVTASCDAEYEWGVHIAVYADKAGLTERQIASLVTGGPDDACWDDADRVLIRLCDALQQHCTVDDEALGALTATPQRRGDSRAAHAGGYVPNRELSRQRFAAAAGAGRAPVPGVGIERVRQRHAARHAEICRGAVIDWRPYDRSVLLNRSSFVHLHNHTEYSMLDGAAKVKPMLAEAQRLEMPAIGMTDHGNMFGASEFYNGATEAGIKPIIGVEAYIAPGRGSTPSAFSGVTRARSPTTSRAAGPTRT